MSKLKHLKNLPITTTTHGIGEKRVLLSNAETETAITQIAVTKLNAGEEVEHHSHTTMEEYFIIRKGSAEIISSVKQLLPYF